LCFLFGCEKTNTEHRIKLKFLVEFGKTPTEALKLLQEVYGDDTMSRSREFEWHKWFQDGREDVEVDFKAVDHQQAEPVKISSL